MVVWSVERAQAWYTSQSSWKLGVNFIPSTAVNQIQMWQDYNVTTIKRELQFAANLGYNALRVFLHDQMYQYEGQGFLDKVDAFLTTASNLGFKTILVLLEGIWDPNPRYTPGISQPKPRPFVHNSRWLQSPGADVLANDTALLTQVKPYVQAIVQRFGNDTQRVLMLDLMDQPDNCNLLSYGDVGERVPATQDAEGTEWEPSIKLDLIREFIPQLLDWVDQANPGRLVPVTIADWYGQNGVMSGPLGQVQEELRQVYLHNASDIVTFHHYGTPDELLDKLKDLQQATRGRPVFLSSFLARDEKCTLDPILGDLYARNVWAMHWGLVNGLTQTIWNSDSWNERYFDEPTVWHHDLLWPNGTVYDEAEREYLLSFRNNNQTTNKNATTQPPLAPNDASTTTTASWAELSVNLVGALGLVAIVLTCGWYIVAQRQRRIQARASAVSFHAVEQVELKEFS